VQSRRNKEMARPGRKPKVPRNDGDLDSLKSKTPKTPKRSQTDEINDQLEATIFKGYEEFFEAVPDRRKNLFKLDIPSFNHVMGGGLPRGQMVHLYGPEGTGKSTLALHMVASVQASGGRVLFIDQENALETSYAKALGVNVDPPYLKYMRKNPNGEVVLDIIEKAVRSGLYALIVVDSVATLAPANVLEASNQEVFVAAQARMLTQGLMKLNHAAVNSDTIILWVNQQRSNISKMPNARQFTTPGGKALPFYANINILIQRFGPIKEGEQIIGQQAKIKVEKNKIAAPMREVLCNMIYGYGFRKDLDLIISAKDAEMIQQKGSWFEYNGIKLGQGLNSVVEYAKAHEEFLKELEDRLYGEVPVAVIAPIASDSGEVVPASADGEPVA
jgi:recombination protein RecA